MPTTTQPAPHVLILRYANVSTNKTLLVENYHNDYRLFSLFDELIASGLLEAVSVAGKPGVRITPAGVIELTKFSSFIFSNTAGVQTLFPISIPGTVAQHLAPPL
jgi:hypothetical protein